MIPPREFLEQLVCTYGISCCSCLFSFFYLRVTGRRSRTQATTGHLRPLSGSFLWVVIRSIHMITPDIHDDSLWVPQGTHRNTYTPDPNPLNSSGTPYYYEERDLPDSTTGIDWITDTRMDHDFMWGYH